jgi:hypothetical protein
MQCYTAAIVEAPDWPVLLVNRAMCQKNRGHWDDVEADSRRALELDSRSMKVGDASHACFTGAPAHAVQVTANLTYQAGSVVMAFTLASMWAKRARYACWESVAHLCQTQL